MAMTLKDHLDALPAELYKGIFDFTFTTDSLVHTIESTYKPPSCLQVNQGTRATFAKSYYGLDVAGKGDADCTIFYINQDDCPKWLRSLKQEDVDMLEEVRYRDTGIHLWAGSSEEVLKNAFERHAWGMYTRLRNEIEPSPILDEAQLCLPCKDFTKGTNWEEMFNGIGGEDKYRSIVDLENGVWSTLAKDDVPDFVKKGDEGRQ